MFWMWMGAAWACSLAGPQDFLTTAEGEPVGDAPVKAELVGVRIGRGSAGVDLGGGRFQSSSCDDLGSVSITVAEPGAGLGLRLAFADGTLPDGVEGIREAPQVGDKETEGRRATVMSWVDEASDDQEPFDFDVVVTVVDAWGRESEPLTVQVSDPGSTAATVGSCSTAPGAAGLAWSLLALGARRRRRLTGS